MKFKPILILTCILIVSPAVAQVIPEYDLGGASKPKPDLSFKKEKQYKRVHQASLRFILRGELDKTEAFLTQYLKNTQTMPRRFTCWGFCMDSEET